MLNTSVSHAVIVGGAVIVDGVEYTLQQNGNFIVTGYDQNTPLQSLHILGELDDGFVEGIAPGAFQYNDVIKQLRIDEGITSIGTNAFWGCNNLEIAVLPEGLVTIGEAAFFDCTSLTEFVIPSTVREIQAQAFMGCTGVTDVYFLMDDAQALQDFVWWDGWYQNIPGEYESSDPHGGIEFNKSRKPYEGDDPRIEHAPVGGTHVHIPAGTSSIYNNSTKLEAWLLEESLDECHPLWWIVNYGVVGRQYTVCDDLLGVYVDVEKGLYAKDYGKWLTPDVVYPNEIDLMKGTNLMTGHEDGYDQSNWVVLRGLENRDEDPSIYVNRVLKGGSITGTLLNKKNPEIKVAETSTPKRDNTRHVAYNPNVYIPCSFMGRTQRGVDDMIYAFVQPKPQEYMKVVWTVYQEGDEGAKRFFIPAPDYERKINLQKLAGGFDTDFKLYENPPVPTLDDNNSYEFTAINRLKRTPIEDQATSGMLKNENENITPHTDGGVSQQFMAYPLELPDEPTIPTAITPNELIPQRVSTNWFSIDGRNLGNAMPTTPGLYIGHGRKVIVK